MDLVLLSAIISVLALDVTIAFQVLISSPLFACPILGWLLGDIKLGFELGFLFQLLWLGRIPAGANIIPEGNLASMIACSLIILNKSLGLPNTTLTLVFIEGIIISYLGAQLTRFYRKINGKILDMIIHQVRNTHFAVILVLEIFSIIIYFILVFVLTFLIFESNQQFLPGLISFWGGLFENQFVVVKPVILGMGLAFVFPLLKDSLKKKTGKSLE